MNLSTRCPVPGSKPSFDCVQRTQNGPSEAETAALTGESEPGKAGVGFLYPTVLVGDVLEMLRTLPDESVNCIVTSPPYWGLRDYGVDGQIGLEKTPQEFVAKMVEVFRECRRVLRKDGTCWVNMGDSYNANSTGRPHSGLKALSDRTSPRKNPRENHAYQDGEMFVARGAVATLKPKDLCGIPWRLAFALQDDGWYLRQDIIWSKPNPMPESVTDRCTKAHEYIFLLSKSERYAYDADAIRIPVAEATTVRLSQDVANQRGSKRVPGKTNGPMKAAQTRGMRCVSLDAYGLTRGTANPSCVNAMGANRRSVWEMTTKPYADAHFATFPEELPQTCILAGCPEGGVVLDPFAGSGTTLAVALSLGRQSIGIELNPEYAKLIRKRLSGITPPLFSEAPVLVREAPNQSELFDGPTLQPQI